MSETIFRGLIKEARKQLKAMQEDGATLFNQGKYQLAGETAARAKRIQALIVELERQKREWAALFPEQATLFDTPKKAETKQKKTPERAYYRPILEALVEMGGHGETAKVVDRVGEMMAGQLNDFDQKVLPSGRDLRWRNTAEWARNTMVKKGWLKTGSPYGVWEIAEQGLTWLEEEKKRG